MRYKVKDDVSAVSVGETELEISEDGIIEVSSPEHAAALVQFERDGVLTRLPDEPAVKVNVRRSKRAADTKENTADKKE